MLEFKTKPDRSDNAEFRSEIEQLKSNFCFILGKMEHAEENYQQAFEFYEQALRHNTKNYEAMLCMSKV